MAFTPPGFSTVRVNTRNLDITLSTLLGRYKIADVDDAVIKRNSLEVLIARTQQVIDCKSARATQLEVFNLLINELREVLKLKDQEKNNKGTLFLLGALLHRYFRLMQEYDNWSTRFYTWDPRSCKLFLAIRAALQLPEQMPYDYRQTDLAILDVTTIVTALETFRDNMKLKDEQQIPRFKKYHHFAVEDPNFETHLQEIIDKYKMSGAPVLKQFKAIDFIQSLADKVEAEHQLIKQTLLEWNRIFAREHPDFDFVNIETIESHMITHIKTASTREKILDLLYTPFIKSNTENADHHSFLAAMKKCSSDTACHTIIGGYSLLLQYPGMEKLKFCINQALGIEKNTEDLTNEDSLTELQFLKQFIEKNPEAALNYEFFGGKNKMNTQILQIEEALTHEIKEQKEETSSVVFV
ncbi:hypothetical protein TUM19329_21600 [Legionella antarctica]|uniref:Substrate of the Dot/Icm secretion system n=1 Tax=Legionella antarctica TaxID=2708020 RepID=A0A6F8T5S0_9GAMM|nr:type IV secretion protein Dot [Legionella antarctica]BCA95799.1 hypothetical protein TUM19329_21600 [Legionella antarctica]